MGKKGKSNKMEGNASTVIRDVQWGNTDEEDNELVKELELAKNETAVGFESADVLKDNWEEPQKADDQMSKEEFNSDYNELQKKNEEDDERLKQRLRMQNVPSLSNKTRIEEEKELPEWELENCSPVTINKRVGKYSTQMSCGLLATMANEGIIYYNENSQRSRKKKKNGETTPYLMASKVKKIYNELISGELNGMLITLNARILKDEYGNILNHLDFDEDNKILNGSGFLDAIDGWHRISASILWLRKWNIKKNQKTMPSPWDYEFIVAIENKEEVGGGLIFKEYGSTQLKIQPSKVKFLDVYDYTNMIVRKLMNSSLRDKVEIDKTRTKGTKNIVTFGTLSDSIKKNFKINTEEDVKLISNHLNVYFNKLINLFPDYFGNMPKEERDSMRQKDTLHLELLMFHGYIAVSSRLYGKEDWKSKLLKLKEKIKINNWEGTILQSDCPLWTKIFRGEGKDKKIVSGSSSVSFVSKTMGDYIEFGIDYVIDSLKEE